MEASSVPWKEYSGSHLPSWLSLATLVFLSPPLSIFLFVLLPLTGFIIGRVSRALRKQSNIAQEQLGTLMSILDETLGGLRVIKAFNAENLLRSKFFKTNNYLNLVRNKIIFRRDMASPMSELLGVIVLCCILFFGGQNDPQPQICPAG